jgi:tRNA threonylcarbamoyladenosine biosynthesis protein TsaE
MCNDGPLKKNSSLRILCQSSSFSAKETFCFGESLANRLKPPVVLALIGELGAGKTTLIKGIFHSLRPSCFDEIHSPTFTYLHVHEGPIPIYHFDLWRIGNEQEFLQMGFEEYFHQKGICLIEWSDKILSLLPPSSFVLEILHKKENERELILSTL